MVPVELTMLYGHETGTITDDIWYVPHKFYKLTKAKMWHQGVNTDGFELTFSPPAGYVGWSDVTHMFGFNSQGFTAKEVWFDE